jgi:CBS domain-containing protein
MQSAIDILEGKHHASNVIKPEAMVIEALQLLNKENLSYLVVKESGEFKGIFSERDYTRKLVLQGRSSRETMVRDVMTTELPVVDPGASVEECMNLLASHRGSRYILVFEGKEFKGVITIHDLLRHVLANKEDLFDDSITSQLIDNDESGLIY